MNRNEEYWALVAQLSDTPPELEGTVERARARARKRTLKRWLGKSLKELNFRVKYNMTVIAVVKDDVIRPNLHPDYTFKEDEHLLVLGRSEDIQRIIR